MSAQGLPLNKEGFGPLVADVVNLPSRRHRGRRRLFAEHGDRVAAILTEPVQGAGGVYPPPDGLPGRPAAAGDQHGCYLIFDEVICGFGRLGRWFGGEHFGVRADLTTFAKAVTSGYVPLGGVVVGPCRPRRRSRPTRPGCCATATPTPATRPRARPRWPTSDILKEEGLVERAAVVGAAPLRGLRGHRRRRPRWPRSGPRSRSARSSSTPDHDAFAVRDALDGRRRPDPRREPRDPHLVPAARHHRRPDRPRGRRGRHRPRRRCAPPRLRHHRSCPHSRPPSARFADTNVGRRAPRAS